jgi:glutamate carboxypeptidase
MALQADVAKLAPYRDAIDRACAEPMLDQLLAWAAINSGSRNMAGLASVASMLADAVSGLPGEGVLLDPDPVTTISPDGREVSISHGRNLLLTVRPEAPMQLLLTGHMDTVFPADSDFQTCRWEVDGTLNGPGVADMKGGIAVMLAALKGFETSPSKDRLGYQLLLNSDEEVGSLGSASLLKTVAQGKYAALTYEPSVSRDGTLAAARPGSGNFSIIVTGVSAHAGRNPHEGRNAVVAASEIAVRLADLVGSDLSVNPARIDGGSPNNVVPDHAVLRVNMRPRTMEEQERALGAVNAILSDVASRRDVKIALHGGFNRPPKPLDRKSAELLELVRACGALLGQDIRWEDSGGVCDGNNIAACGVPVVDTLGVRGGNIHSAEEFLVVESLVERASLSTLILCRMASQDI